MLPQGADLREGRSVIIKCDCTADDDAQTPLKAGLKGTLRQIDEDGDAEIYFPNIGDVWIFQSGFDAKLLFPEPKAWDEARGEPLNLMLGIRQNGIP